MAIQIRPVDRQGNPRLFQDAADFLAEQCEFPKESLGWSWITDVLSTPRWTRVSIATDDGAIVGICVVDVSEMRPGRFSGEVYGAIDEECEEDIEGRLLRATVDQFKKDLSFGHRKVPFLFSIGSTEEEPFGAGLAFHTAPPVANAWGPGEDTVVAYIRPSDL